jgi:hypothetical protein
MPTSMDHSKYRYVNFEGRPNVWIGYHLSAPATRYRIDGLVLDTARILFTRAPKNTFIFTGPLSASNDVAAMTLCTIERNDEIIGKLSHAYGRNGDSVCVDNERVRKERLRGGGMITSDAKRAAALVMKKFVPTSTEENLLKGYSAMQEKLQNLASRVIHAKTSALSAENALFLTYVENTWDDDGQLLLRQIGVPPSRMAGIDEVIREKRRHQSLINAREGGMTFVMLKGDTIHAVPMKVNSGVPDLHQRTYAYTDAPDDMRVQVGKLKLADEGAYYPDVGMRLGSNTFAIFYDLNHEQDTGDEEGDEEDEEDA